MGPTQLVAVAFGALASGFGPRDPTCRFLLTLIRELDRRERHRDHGLPSMVAWLSWRVGLGPVAAREKVRVAKALALLPEIDLALSRAEVSYSKVRALTRVATPETEAKLLHMARQGTAAQLETICRGVEQVTGTSPEAQARWVKLKPCKDGMARIEIRLHADEAALVMKAIDAAVEEARDDGGDASAEAPAAGSSRPDGLLRVADAFLAGQRPDGRVGGERHQLLVCIKESALHPGGVCAEAEGVTVAHETLRRLACDASVTRISVADDATPLDVGRKVRTVSPALRRALVARDGGCRFPGCTNHRWVDAHHIEHWVDGGETRCDNLVLLCTRHHRLLHEGGFRLTGSAANLRFERPDGTAIDVPIRSTADGPALPTANPPRPPCMATPNYHWAIGAALPKAA